MALTKTTRRNELRGVKPRGMRPSRARRSIPNITPIGCSQPVSKTLPAAVRRIVDALHPEKVILFGSYAYGKPTPDSDVDLLVVMKTKAAIVDRYLAVSRLLVPRPFAVDIIVRSPEEINRALKVGDFFIEEIMSQGKTLYERE